MGLYDYIRGSVTCPHCGGHNIVFDQIKYGPCGLKTFTTGDRLLELDTTVTFSTTPHRDLVHTCKSCERDFKYEFDVVNGVIGEFRAISESKDDSE